MIFLYKRLLNWVLLTLPLVGSGGGQPVCKSTRVIANHCDCHFIGACDWTKSPPVPLGNAAAALPAGIDSFAEDPTNPKTTEICEGTQNTLAILYECDLRIPLYSARVLTDADMKSTYSAAGLRTGFRMTRRIPPPFRQRNGDYGPNAKDQIPCYESTVSKPAGTMYFETNWYSAALKYGAPPQTCKPKVLKAKGTLSTIDKGHLIASNYGKSALNARQTVRDTFYLSNIVPQFSDMNRGSWVRNEQILLNWASSNCASTSANRRNGRLFVIVGVIPSTFGTFPERYFGFFGFSDFQAKSSKSSYGARSSYKNQYRINVPAVMWTAACCEYEELNAVTNNWDQKYITKAFWGENKPFKQPVYNVQPIGTLFANICAITRSCPVAMPTINLFPNQPLCV